LVERAIGKYVTNGEFIAAALISGYSFKHRHAAREHVAAH